MKYFENEIWKDVPDYEGYYQGSNYGRVKSLANSKKRKEKILKQFVDRDGYCRVVLSKNNIQKSFLVHRLIYLTFNGAIPDGMQINHNSEVKTDNRLENLSLMSAKENINWGTCVERRSEKQRKYILQFSISGDLIKIWKSLLDITDYLGFDYSNISKCCRGEKHTAYGYIWKYVKEGD